MNIFNYKKKSENQMSSNPWEFIRQCKEERKFPDMPCILKEAARLSVQNSYRYVDLHNSVLFIAGSDFDQLTIQREMVCELAREMLSKVIYSQKEFAGKLIALMNEFGVAIAIVDRKAGSFNETYFVSVYAPTDYGDWGKRYEFETEEDARLWADHVNGYGTFHL